jgi:hypothetical protein
LDSTSPSKRLGVFGVVLTLALLPATTTADPDHGRHHDHDQPSGGAHGDNGHGDHGDRGDHGDKGDKGDKDDRDDDERDDRDDAPDAAPVPPPPGLTPEQTDFRGKLVSREHDAVDAFARRNGKHISTEDRQTIRAHWRHVMRLLRIREVAQAEKDTATIAKCDDLLAKADRWLQAHAKGTGAAGDVGGGK